MWDMPSIVMITLLSFDSDEILYFGAYKILVMRLSRIQNVIWAYTNSESVFSDVF